MKQAHAEGMVSRAAYKLEEMNKTLKIIKPGYNILDLGAAPGGWTQVVISNYYFQFYFLTLFIKGSHVYCTVLWWERKSSEC